jgi:RNA polymerase sigma-70 factor (sigma-E family)
MRLRSDKRHDFERFAAAEGPGLYRLAYNLCGNRERAEDAVQEALAEVYRRWSRLREPLAYSRRVTVNATRDEWRRSSRQDQAGEALMHEPEPAPKLPQDLVLERDALMRALDELPHRQRAVVVLRYGSQLSEAETAAALEIPVNTVKTHSRRALLRMRETLSDPSPHTCQEAPR